MTNDRISRRNVLATSGAALGAGLLGRLPFAPPSNQRKRLAKNIIFCVVDGMAVSVMSMLDHYLQLTTGKGSYWSWLMDQPFVVNGLQDVRSLSSVVTDSAAAAAAWGSGRRQWNGQINMYPDGTKLTPLYSLLKEDGMRTGLVTTTTVTHATPSGFAIQIDQRDKEAEIATQHLARGVDVLMGGGDRFFGPRSRADRRDLYAEFARKGYAVARSRDEMLAAAADRLLGVFATSHLPYSVDREQDAQLKARVPTLAEMATKAIELLSRGREGFALQIEGGRVDHGGHANDLAAAFFDQMAFEEAVRVAVEFALRDKETLVIVTADHATGGPSLNGSGEEYFDSTAGLRSVGRMKSSYGRLFDLYRADRSRAAVQEATRTLLNVELSDPEADVIVASLRNESPFGVSEFLRSLNGTVATILGNHTKVLWTSQNHTGDHVVLSALGPGSDTLAGLTPNYQLFDVMLAARGLKFSNPRMTYEEAARHMARKPAAEKPPAPLDDPDEALLRELHTEV